LRKEYLGVATGPEGMVSKPPSAVVCKCEKIEEFVSLSFSIGRLRFLEIDDSPSLLIVEVLPLNRSANEPFFLIGGSTGLNFYISLRLTGGGYGVIIKCYCYGYDSIDLWLFELVD
jgi:hypothetical protein